jgi:hypothetical protein
MSSLLYWQVGLSAVLALGLPASAATTISLQPVADTSIYSAPTLQNLNFGGGPTFTVGGRPRGGFSRGLLLFDVADNVPADAIIQSVTLRVTVTLTPSQSANSIFDLNRLTASWGEGTGADRGGTTAGPNAATWVNRLGSSGSPWTHPGGDYSSTVSGSFSMQGNGNYIFSSNPILVADVQGWLDNRSSNFGWLMRSESESTGRTIRRFGSRLDALHSPVLTIHYAVPEPGASCLFALGIAVLCVHRWRLRRKD